MTTLVTTHLMSFLIKKETLPLLVNLSFPNLTYPFGCGQPSALSAPSFWSSACLPPSPPARPLDFRSHPKPCPASPKFICAHPARKGPPALLRPVTEPRSTESSTHSCQSVWLQLGCHASTHAELSHTLVDHTCHL